jgi:hypothetical protein
VTAGTAAAAEAICDAMLDLLALTEAAVEPGFAEKREAILNAWRDREGIAFVYAALLLIRSAISELPDPAGWIAEERQQALAGEAP